MAFNDDQKEFPLPDGSDGRRRSAQHLPRYFRTQVNNKFLASTFDQLIQPGAVEKISGFFGRRQARAFSTDDFYINDVSTARQNYQLEPAAVIKDNLDNVNFYADYNDYINQIRNLKGNTSNHSILNKQEYYAWNPHIDWDKFVNFREYYWLPNGPDSVPVAGQSIEIESTYTVTSEDNLDNNAFIFTPDGLTRNPELVLYRGITYRFEIDSPGVPLSFRRSRTTAREWTAYTAYRNSELVRYEGKVYIANGDHRSSDDFETDQDFWDLADNINLLQEASAAEVEQGVIELTLTPQSPDSIYYVSDNDVNAGGLIRVYDIEEAAFIDVEKEILGKKTYRTGQGFDLTNGMKIYFQGTTAQPQYEQGNWYVEGVGDAIKLVSEDDLVIASAFVEDEFVEFDKTGFDTNPYSYAIGFPREKDYITINRSSLDGNLWSKYNRWFHRSVIEKAAEINKTGLSLDQNLRASRPIIEFEAGLKLYEFGTEAKPPIDLVDDFTTDVFSTVEGKEGYNIDGIDLTEGMRILFTADSDIFVQNKIFEVKFIDFKGTRQISLIEAADADPLENQTVLCRQGSVYGGKVLYYVGDIWSLAQDKISVNQEPLFDIFDCDDQSLADKEAYPSSDFVGTPIFSYKKGTGPIDSELGFALSYRNIQNVGDIAFDFNLSTDAVNFCPEGDVPLQKGLGTGYLRKYFTRTNYESQNGWSIAHELSSQPVIKQAVAESIRPIVDVDVYNESALVEDLWIRVYVNNALQFEGTDYELIDSATNIKQVRFTRNLEIDDIIQIKTKSSTPKNQNGFYEIPFNLERNPLNEDLTELTLGEINDHVGSIVEEVDGFSGSYPGQSNLRDLSNLSKYGKRVIRHSAPHALAAYHLIDKEANLQEAIRFARIEYAKFKRSFIQAATDLAFDGTIDRHFETVIKEVLRDRSRNDAFYFSDMVPFGGAEVSRLTVRSGREKFFSLTAQFNLNEPSNRAVLVYLNEQQLVHGNDYVFNDEGFIEFIIDTQVGDEVVIYEFETTVGNFVPPTPTKLGLYPKYKPEIFEDDTYLEPRKVIQGHDGSIIAAFGDFRDDLILELEKRIYNNIKVDYDPEVFDILDYVPSESRNTGLTLDQINNSLLRDFVQWLRLVDRDYNANVDFDRDNGFTYNYTGNVSRNNSKIKGSWRSVYQFAYDTDRPHTHPWEMLGFAEKPAWWNEQYGPAPYTSENLLLWEDLEKGTIREPGVAPKTVSKYVRPGLVSQLPVDNKGNLLPPSSTRYVQNFNDGLADRDYQFGDRSPVETAWRRSSEYPFALLSALFVNQPNRIMSVCFDRLRQLRGLVGDIIYNAPNTVIQLKDLIFPNTANDQEQIFTSGLVNYVKDFLTSNVEKSYEDYKERLRSLDVQLGLKLAGYANKDKLRFILDSRSPLNEGNVFIPDENYQISFNKSAPINLVYYSGVLIEKQPEGFVIRGYNQEEPVFRWTPPVPQNADKEIRVGGISAPVLRWESQRTLTKDAVVEFQNQYYRVTETHNTGINFDASKFARLPKIPETGGRTAFLRTRFQRTSEVLPYNSLLRTTQVVVDFLQGYENYLKNQGFVFDYYDRDRQYLSDFNTAVREFLFWTTQNWSAGSIITLSPGAYRIKLNSQFAAVDDVFESLYGYGSIKADGNRLEPEFISLTRQESGVFEVQPRNTADGIFGIRLPLVQKEHVVTFDSRTSFGDIIFDRAAGYRQERIRVIGYRTANWDGSLNIPGFIYDDVNLEEWQPWKDYAIGDVVSYKEFFYSAKNKISGSETFNAREWNRLLEKPESELIPNFEYKTDQFADFYDLDSDNFDSEQQKFAQHLIGYQNRQYLANIINDDVSQYKFYQGFIKDKGTQNALTKLFDALGAADKESLEFYEEWAIKSAQYGAADGFKELEYLLDEKQFRLDPQPIELVQRKDNTSTDLVYQIIPSEVFRKPSDYDHAPFPEKIVTDTFVKESGYVYNEDVDFILDTYRDLLTIDFDSLFYGNTVWLGNDDLTWSVYTFVSTDAEIESIEEQEQGFALGLTNTDQEFSPGEIVGIYNIGAASGLYEILDVQNNKIII